jgi:hypothetical protein
VNVLDYHRQVEAAVEKLRAVVDVRDDEEADLLYFVAAALHREGEAERFVAMISRKKR